MKVFGFLWGRIIGLNVCLVFFIWFDVIMFVVVEMLELFWEISLFGMFIWGLGIVLFDSIFGRVFFLVLFFECFFCFGWLCFFKVDKEIFFLLVLFFIECLGVVCVMIFIFFLG